MHLHKITSTLKRTEFEIALQMCLSDYSVSSKL